MDESNVSDLEALREAYRKAHERYAEVFQRRDIAWDAPGGPEEAWSSMQEAARTLLLAVDATTRPASRAEATSRALDRVTRLRADGVGDYYISMGARSREHANQLAEEDARRLLGWHGGREEVILSDVGHGAQGDPATRTGADDSSAPRSGRHETAAVAQLKDGRGTAIELSSSEFEILRKRYARKGVTFPTDAFVVKACSCSWTESCGRCGRSS
jgi:hypothetical protein